MEDTAKLTIRLMQERSHQGLPMHFSQGDLLAMIPDLIDRVV
jgi:hypothetical protein